MAIRQAWTIDRTTNPSDLPISPREVKQQLNLPSDFTHHDEKLLDYIGAATERFEADTDCVCIESTFVLYLDELTTGPINLMKRPIVAVDSITCTGDDGNPLTVDPSVYQVSAARRQITLAYGQAWPGHVRHNESVEVTFRAGMPSPLTVPRFWRQAVALAVGSWFLDPADERARDQWKTSYDAIARRYMSVNEI